MNKPARNLERKRALRAALAPRMAWDSQRLGTVVRGVLKTPSGLRVAYSQKRPVAKRKRALTEAEDNAIGRAIRRREHRKAKPWRPYAQR